MQPHGLGKTIGQSQRGLFVRLDRYFLAEHHVAFGQAPKRYEAPSTAELSTAIDLVDIG
jgi:hypothetical protein